LGLPGVPVCAVLLPSGHHVWKSTGFLGFPV
jgi:hypothetical protein